MPRGAGTSAKSMTSLTRLHAAAAVLVTASFLAVGPVPASAHHSFSAEFDAKNCSDTVGTLTRLDWQNPHAYFFIEVKDASGQAQEMEFQLSSIANLTRGGSPRRMFIENFGKTVMARGCSR